MDHEALSDALDALSDPALAKTRGREVRSIKGVRGVPDGEIARIAAAAWAESGVQLPGDEDALNALFATAHEDGLVAIGLLAAALVDRPSEALDIGRDWLERTGDTATADAIGWLVLGPGSLASGTPPSEVYRPIKGTGREVARRAAVMMGMAMLPTPIEGPCAAPLRKRLGQRVVQFVDRPLRDEIAELCLTFVRDESPPVRKALRRVLGAWASTDPDTAETWIHEVRGGVAKMLSAEVAQAARRARRKAGA